MKYPTFCKLVDIKENEEAKANYFIKRRGLEEHIKVAKFLAANSTNRVAYSEVATVFRYDKRIRRILYKYIGYIEELIRAFVSNRYSSIDALPKKCREKISNDAFGRATDKTSTFEVISYDLFINLLHLAQSLSFSQQHSLFPCLAYKDEENFEALNRLRDQIGHNKLLIDNHDLFEVKLNHKITGSILKQNILNLLNFLPRNLHKNFIKEINEADFNNGKPKPYQTDWVLSSFLVIKIEDQ